MNAQVGNLGGARQTERMGQLCQHSFSGQASPACYHGGMNRGSWALGLSAILILTAPAAARRQEPKPNELPEAPAPKQEQTPQKHTSRLQSTFEVLGRRSIFFPDLAASPGPLSSKEKLELFAGKSIAPSRLVSSALSAGLAQARDTVPAYGGGIGGYSKRFASSMATGASTEFFSTFLFASLFRRDPRYLVSLRGGTLRRIGYGVSRLVVARTDAGTEGANWPGILGPLFAESLANSNLPATQQAAGQTFRRYGVRLGFTAGTNVVKEYWPTIFRSLRIAKIAPGLSPNATPAVARPPATLRFLP